MPSVEAAGSPSADGAVRSEAEYRRVQRLSVHLPGTRAGTWVLGGASLAWIAQAALLAWAVQSLTDGGGLTGVIWPAVGYLLFGIARATAEAWGTRQLFHGARRYLSGLRVQAVAALAGRSPLDSTRPSSGQAASVLTEQAEALLPWLLRYQPARWRVIVVPPVIAVVVGSLSWVCALILIAAAPLIPLFMALIGWRAKAASEEQLQALGGMNGFLLDRLRGLSTLRALGAVDATAHRLRASAESLRMRTMRVLRIAFLSSASLELFSALAVALVAVYVGFHLLGQIGSGSWGKTLSLGQGLFILLLAPAFFEPLRDLSAAWHDKAAGEAAHEALDSLRKVGLALPGALDEQASDAPPARARCAPAVDIRALRFGYASEATVFDGTGLHVGAGEHVALVGSSGIGKTTLLSIIAGLVPALNGEVRIGSVLLNAATAAALRSRVAWIGQKPHVFAGTVRGNISMHRPGVSEAAVTAAIHFAALGRVRNALSDGRLSEGGAGLSGGELVRLALARAAADPTADLLLVDEPTAHLDRDTAAEVIDALLHLARGRTLIVATHDLALAGCLGRIIRVDDAFNGHPVRSAA